MSVRPILFSFNIRRSIFDTYGLIHFKHLLKLKQLKTPLILIPVVTGTNDGIEQRSAELAKRIHRVLFKYKIPRYDLVSYSLSGIDARYFLAQYQIPNQKCTSLTTIATPHLGSRAAELAESKVFEEVKMEPIARLLGVGLRGFHEVNRGRMTRFNKDVGDVSGVKYYSIGAERLPNNCQSSLMELGSYLRLNNERNYTYENDGVFGHDEVIWGQHLVNFEADHSEVVGINPAPHMEDMFNLIQCRLADSNSKATSKEDSASVPLFSTYFETLIPDSNKLLSPVRPHPEPQKSPSKHQIIKLYTLLEYQVQKLLSNTFETNLKNLTQQQQTEARKNLVMEFISQERNWEELRKAMLGKDQFTHRFDEIEAESKIGDGFQRQKKMRRQAVRKYLQAASRSKARQLIEGVVDQIMGKRFEAQTTQEQPTVVQKEDNIDLFGRKKSFTTMEESSRPLMNQPSEEFHSPSKNV